MGLLDAFLLFRSVIGGERVGDLPTKKEQQTIRETSTSQRLIGSQPDLLYLGHTANKLMPALLFPGPSELNLDRVRGRETERA